MTVAARVACTHCGGTAQRVLRPYAVERGGTLIVVRDVPMLECDDCAETYFTTEVMRELDRVIADVATGQDGEAIIRFPVAA